jgi:hypothetical protein
MESWFELYAMRRPGSKTTNIIDGLVVGAGRVVHALSRRQCVHADYMSGTSECPVLAEVGRCARGWRAKPLPPAMVSFADETGHLLWRRWADGWRFAKSSPVQNQHRCQYQPAQVTRSNRHTVHSLPAPALSLFNFNNEGLAVHPGHASSTLDLIAKSDKLRVVLCHLPMDAWRVIERLLRVDLCLSSLSARHRARKGCHRPEADIGRRGRPTNL